VADSVREQLGNYRLIHVLGRGTFADVFLGQHVYLQTQAAIKVLHEQLTNADVDGFFSEARTIAYLRHPHIIQVLDFGVENATPFLVMDYAPNGNLRQRYPKGTRLPLDLVVTYVKQVASALQYAHDERLIHRDIKPENILLGRNDEILLSDFGIAILAESVHSQKTQEAAGTLAYMAPEQFQAQASPASDQYALSVVVYEWLCGDRPFHGSFPEIAVKHTRMPPPALREQVPTIPPAMEQVVFKALAKDPQQRFASIQDFAMTLEEASRAATAEGTHFAPVSGHPIKAGQSLTSSLPEGTVTLLFTDIAGSTQLLLQLGDRYEGVLTTCRQLLRTAFQQWNGYEVDTQGDAFFVVFARATDAVSAAVAAQRSCTSHSWPEGVEVRVRMGLHTGEPERSAEGYVGLDVHLTARLLSAAHGGQILLSRTTQELVEHDLPEDVSLRDLGVYHLKDFHDPKRLFQVVIAGLPADFPPLRTRDVRLNNLSVQLSSLVGREQEVRQVSALLQRPDVRLVTLTGMGGIGKTRLGLQVATELLDAFADGTYFVSLAAVTDPVMVIDTIAHLLGLEHQQIGQRVPAEHMEYLKALLRDKHLLLLLDNFEQVLAAAPDLAELLIACPHLKMLVTSRAVLHIQGEHEFPVPPLALPKRTQLAANVDLSQYAAVALFLERALAIKPDLALTEANLQAIAAICVHLDGLPLAIELAAARIKLFPPRALLQRMTHRLDVLTGGVQGAPRRQQTLRNTIAWSYNLLDATEQQLFQRLSVFVGSYTLEAVEALCSAFADGAGQVLDGVASLIDKSLLLQIEREGEEPRLVMLETIREYGLEVLAASGEEEMTRQAHAAYYLALAEEAEPEYGGPQQVVWLERLEREHDNLRAALQWSIEPGATQQRIEIGLRLGGALRRFWLVHGHWSEGRSFLERALAASEGIAASVRAKALITAANIAVTQSDYDCAEALCQESLALYRELGDQPGISYSLYLLAWAARDRDNFAAARSFAEEALVLFREIGDKGRAVWSLFTLASLDAIQGAYARACVLLEEALALFREQENKLGIAWSLTNLAWVHLDAQDDPAIIHSLLEESLVLWRDLGDPRGTAHASLISGRLALHQGDVAKARSLAEESVKLYKEIGDRRGTTESLILLARVVTFQGDYKTVQRIYKEGLAIARETKHKWVIASCLEGLASVIAAQEQVGISLAEIPPGEQVSLWATRLWGAAEVLREAVSVPIPFVDRATYERTVTAVRSQLGEKAFAAAWAKGRTMTLEQALTLQEQEMVSAPTMTVATTTPSPTYPAGLTAREVGVLRLVARGLTNAEIAGELRLSEKTIAHHLTHIFNKTTSENRAAAAAFAIRHGLA
jgi:predicted ATPase/class 3 adenylate cyclase/DNA-binding CsgD family transcriptional regulator